MFLLCSGFGLCFSYRKDKNIFTYFKKRITRLLPEYWLFVLLSVLLLRFSISHVLLLMTATRFYIVHSDYYGWFVALIALLYLLFPFLYRFMTDKDGRLRKWRTIVILALLIEAIIVLHVINPVYNEGMCMVFDRIPVFIVGMILGITYNPEKTIVSRKQLLIVFAALLLLLAAYWGYMHSSMAEYLNMRYMLYFPVSIPMFILLIFVLSLVEPKYSVFGMLGKITFSLYLSDSIIEQVIYRADQLGIGAFNKPLIMEIVIIILGVAIHYLAKLVRYSAARMSSKISEKLSCNSEKS